MSFEKPQDPEESEGKDVFDSIEDSKRKTQALKLRALDYVHAGDFDEASKIIESIPDEGTSGDNGQKIRDQLRVILLMEQSRKSRKSQKGWEVTLVLFLFAGGY